MRRKTIVLLVAIISLCVVLLQFVVKRNNLLQFEILGKNTQDTKEWDSANKPRLEPLTGSEESGHLSDLFQNKQKEWMKSVVLTRSTAPLPKVDAVNCTKIWQNDEQELRAAHDYQQSNGTQPTKNVRHYLQETANCTSYLLNGGFLSASVDENELSFPLAFSLMVHSNVEQVERLLRAVYRPHNVYCIHPDNKSSDDFHSSLRFIAGCLPNVNIIERPVNIEWGKYSVLQADVECMQLLWRQATKWRYYINLTGQEFPLKTNKEIVRILQAFNGANDITGTHNEIFHFRWTKYLPAPYNVTISKGDVHIIASRAYVDYALNSRVARDLYKWVAPTFIPDEIFSAPSTTTHNWAYPGRTQGTLLTTENTFTATKSGCTEVITRVCATAKLCGVSVTSGWVTSPHGCLPLPVRQQVFLRLHAAGLRLCGGMVLAQGSPGERGAGAGTEPHAIRDVDDCDETLRRTRENLGMKERVR
ncbi:beta-1,3-galactosyl-O-glycosyl-glycoprotein beta-1,6-N-acetylglucosaminyltransferase 4-like isoform X3 [Pomacea canaliculata]|nr:beta-1,3-galactosyl-O-glycosyl-glycoprotein beta-1,6-N-acetylglucosaminyltransferase 4-like isoform X3 [Pomacea canaliculata]